MGMIFLIGDWPRPFYDENADRFIFQQDFDAITSYALISARDSKNTNGKLMKKEDKS